MSIKDDNLATGSYFQNSWNPGRNKKKNRRPRYFSARANPWSTTTANKFKGELAADRIYAGQLAVLSKDHKLTPIIREMWEQERNHLDEMERLITQYELRPTIFAPFCNIAGYMLGK